MADHKKEGDIISLYPCDSDAGGSLAKGHEIRLKVEPEDLIRQASKVISMIQKLETDWNSYYESVYHTRYYWQGDAANIEQKILKDFQEDMKRILEGLKEYPEDLLKMSGHYKEAEKANTDTISILAGDVIS